MYYVNLDRRNTIMFPLFKGQENSNLAVLEIIKSYLQILKIMSLKHNFSNLNIELYYDWIRNPFTFILQTYHSEVKQKAI